MVNLYVIKNDNLNNITYHKLIIHFYIKNKTEVIFIVCSK